ncbi:class I SAM-dependent methyltransferase [Streptomyces sp. SL13]|uniref:Class I SAM-dependent methyltransferase n=1 Tax=Streptantibioticus silvisoli TaxID=2705255 RepID=A0AA90H883_9ACTN|nr:class I SAM-dependent methyltransferase [Streptantibioticus silvisoli]MDI5965111.1 class I SAM-dependent methyltransferase [Streptantibioticus silvisoli]MDI5972728.1 class I SAM-dependent methyltransferase [Streptantibioticus silvisoli]
MSTAPRDDVPDDDAFGFLLTAEGTELLASLRDFTPEQELATATRLRRGYPAPVVSEAVGQAGLRRRAVAKFGDDAWRMFFTPDGVEQATRAGVAEHRARRLAGLGVRRLADLCGGIGGDAIALARAGIEVLAVDRSPRTCAVAAANAAALGLADRITVRCQDVAAVPLDGFDAVFVDPARRGGRGRIFDPEAYSPPLSWAVRAARSAPHAALKVAPGIPHEAVPHDAEAEWVSQGGDVKEAVLWFGTRPGARCATLLPAGVTLTGAGLPDPPAGPVRRYLYEPDGAVIRAHLVAEVARETGGTLIDPTIAYVTSDRLVATPYASAYEITDVLPFNLKRLKALLREREVGTLTVKKRGSAVEPEEVRRRVRPSGPNAATVLLTRVAGAPAMLIGAPAAAE